MFKQADEDTVKSRQKWFWRRTTLQLSILGFMILLARNCMEPISTWPEFGYRLALIAAITALVVVYFAMVDSADKLTKVIDITGKAVGEARDKDSKPDV